MTTHNLLDFQCALITGAGGGLGLAMAEWLFLQGGKKVILVGRTESNLKEAAQSLSSKSSGRSKEVSYYVLDTGKVKEIPSFRDKVLKDHPEVDCIINNAGVQRPLDMTNLDLASLDQEIDIDIRGPIHLVDAFLPHLARKDHAAIMNVTSVLGFCPFSVINPAYNGLKAFLHFHTMNLRTQLKAHHPNLWVVEIAPPSVRTALHRDREDPDDNDPAKGANALTVQQFMDDVVQQWKDNKEMITAGMGHQLVKEWYDMMGHRYQGSHDNWQAKKVTRE